MLAELKEVEREEVAAGLLSSLPAPAQARLVAGLLASLPAPALHTALAPLPAPDLEPVARLLYKLSSQQTRQSLAVEEGEADHVAQV